MRGCKWGNLAWSLTTVVGPDLRADNILCVFLGTALRFKEVSTRVTLIDRLLIDHVTGLDLQFSNLRHSSS